MARTNRSTSRQPDILVIRGDDSGIADRSRCSRGAMGDRTGLSNERASAAKGLIRRTIGARH